MFIALVTTNPAYKTAILAAAFTTLAASAGLRRLRPLLVGVAFIAAFDVVLNFLSAHLGHSVLFALPDSIPGLGGPYTLEALAFGVSGALTIAAAILAAAPFSFLLAPSEVIDALPNALSRTGTAIAASLNLVPSVATSFAEVAEAQRLRGWRPRGPRSWAEVVVPVVLTTAESSIQLAESMEARGFASAPRTSFQKSRIDRGGWLVIATSGLAVVVFALGQATGWVSDWHAYPLLAPPAVDIRGLAACLLLFTPVMIWRRRA
jgi:energy-coupling factor transport system permease protein